MRQADRWDVSSPDGRLSLTVTLDAGDGFAGTLSYEVTYGTGADARSAVLRSSLGVVLDTVDLSSNLTVVDAGEVVDIDERYTLVAGKRRSLRSRGRERVLVFGVAAADDTGTDDDTETPVLDTARLEVVLRAHDDGVAFRYRFPADGGADAVTVLDERTSFALPPGRAWIAPYDAVSPWGPAYETLYADGVAIGSAASLDGADYPGWQFPALFDLGRLWVLLTEAELDGDYCACHLAREADGGVYRIAFPAAEESLGVGDTRPTANVPCATPWRALIVAEDLATIVASDLVTHLASPSRVEDTSWIRPGRSSWSWWSDFDSPRDADALLRFVDLAADLGWEYCTVDANWHTIDDRRLAQLRDHAAGRGVGLLYWYNCAGTTNDVPEGPRDRLHEAEPRRKEFARLRELGAAGVKVDFFDSDKQEMIRRYVGILADAAEHRIMVSLHGSTLPRGWSRTWPHCLTLEAVRGGEQYRLDPSWANAAPRYNAILPFTRDVVGPVDYTPVNLGGPGIPRRTTDAHELALTVVLESGLVTIAASEDGVRDLPDAARRLLTDVPAAWDDTRLLLGDPGRLAVLARRADDEWWIAGINGTDRYLPLAVDLSCVDDDEFVLTVVTDDDRGGLRSTVRTVPRGLLGSIRLEPHGGFLARAQPVDRVPDAPPTEPAPRTL